MWLAVIIIAPPAFLSFTEKATTGVGVRPRVQLAEAAGLAAVQSLRAAGIRAEIGYRGNLKRRMARADKIGASHVVLVRDNSGMVEVRNMDHGNQEIMPIEQIAMFIGA